MTGRHSFTYVAAYADEPDATALSLSMPVAAAEHPPSRIRPYLAGLLPDSEEVRSRWATRFEVSAQNPFALLEHMGLDCAGAVQFIPQGAAMTIGGRREFGRVEGRHWDRFAQACRVSRGMVREEVARQAADLPGVLESVLFDHRDSPLRDRLLLAVSSLAQQTLAALRVSPRQA